MLSETADGLYWLCRMYIYCIGYVACTPCKDHLKARLLSFFVEKKCFVKCSQLCLYRTSQIRLFMRM